MSGWCVWYNSFKSTIWRNVKTWTMNHHEVLFSSYLLLWWYISIPLVSLNSLVQRYLRNGQESLSACWNAYLSATSHNELITSFLHCGLNYLLGKQRKIHHQIWSSQNSTRFPWHIQRAQKVGLIKPCRKVTRENNPIAQLKLSEPSTVPTNISGQFCEDVMSMGGPSRWLDWLPFASKISSGLSA